MVRAVARDSKVSWQEAFGAHSGSDGIVGSASNGQQERTVVVLGERLVLESGAIDGLAASAVA